MTIQKTIIALSSLSVMAFAAVQAGFGITNEVALHQSDPVIIAGQDVARVSAPKGSRGWYDHGLVRKHDGVFDLREMYALRFEVLNDGTVPFSGRAELCLAEGQGRKDRPETASVIFQVNPEPTWREMEIPIDSFDYARGEGYFLKFIASIRFHAGGGRAAIRNLHLVEAPGIKLNAFVRSKAAEHGAVVYEFEAKNCADTVQDVRLRIERDGWEGMAAKLSDEALRLNPGEVRRVTLSVAVPGKLPPGTHETQRVKATPLAPGGHTAELEFITVQRVPSPFLIHDAEGWREVREKVRKYEWARRKADEAIKDADAWQPPMTVGLDSTQGTPSVAAHQDFWKLFECTVAYQLTGQERYGEKMRAFLLLFSNPTNGFPALLHASNQGMPQEGGAMDAVAKAYDVIRERLTVEEREQIENSLRAYVDTLIDGLASGGISNWAIFNQVPGAGCALLLHDLVRFNQLMYGRTGLIDQFRYGILDDGWWYEMSLSYNLHCAENFTRLALMARNFGVDLVHQQFPTATSDLIGIRPYELTNYLGMNFQKSGPVKRNMIGIKAMWDAVLAFPDYRGVMVGMGDGHEQIVSGNQYDLAYYLFRDPRYAAAIRNADDRDLLYAVPELPADPPKLYEESVSSDNAGIALLRSQNGEMRNRIQMGFKYGTHGGYHGHFDRLSLLCLMRYGRGFWNPESTWYGYASYMYKWWVQPSLSHNMVIVDGKMQEPSECRPLVFYAGKNMQVIAVESSARWSHPPYLGGYDVIDKIKAGEEPYVLIPGDHPKIGDVTGYTEPVFQRRLQLVTDDYVLIADYVKSEQEHVFDNIVHLRGAKPVAGVAQTGHRAQFDPSPLSSGQFIVNVDEYGLAAPAKLTSRHHFNEKGQGGQNTRKPFELTDTCYHEPGDLLIDAYVLAPAKAQLLLADYPENQPVRKRLHYEVKGDGKPLASGTIGAWILGKGEVDVDVTGVRALTLSTARDSSRGAADTLFWANAILETRGGKALHLSELKKECRGLKPVPAFGLDYYGGPVRIAGTSCTDTLAAEPLKEQAAGELVFDLSGLDAVRLKAVVGGDFPAGQEENLRKVVSVRTVGKEARFLTLLEPRENAPCVVSARALDAETAEVTLVDGRVDRISIRGLDNPQAVPVAELFHDGKRVESTEEPAPSGQ